MSASRLVFLAHAREDKPQVRKLYADLKAQGFDPWLDEINLMPGQIWKTEIPKAIREASLFLACLSSRSVDKVGYIQTEFRQALSAFGERPPGSIYLIPVRLDECEVPDLQIPDRGLSLKDIQWVDLWQEGGLERLVNAIQHALGSDEDPRTTFAAGIYEPRPPEVPPAPEAKLDQEIARAPPEDATRKRGQERAPDTRGSSRWHPTIVAAIITAVGAVIAAAVTATLSPSFLHWLRGPDVEQQSESAEQEPVASTAPELVNGQVLRDCDNCPEMVVVQAGSFMMGSPSNEGQDDEHPQHEVTIAEPFAVSKYEVTFNEWDACVAAGGCDGYEPDDQGWGRGRRPVMNVSWDQAKAYVEWLSETTGQTYRLLSEAEWEYAARAGTTTTYALPAPDGSDDIAGKGLANCDGCGSEWDNRQTAPVGSFDANAFGLHDTQGNVWEWVEDCWNSSYDGAPSDGSAWTSGDCSRRVLRGGSWYGNPRNLRSANRNRNHSDNRSSDDGFRVARTLR